MLLDGAGYNAPTSYGYEPENKVAKEIKNSDRKDNPVEFLRWQLTESPLVPDEHRISSERVDEICREFQQDILEGRKVWDEEYQDWVPVEENAIDTLG